MQDLHEVPEHLRSARKRHRSALCDALPDKEVPSAWSISDNSCKKIIRVISAIRIQSVVLNKICVYLWYLWENIRFIRVIAFPFGQRPLVRVRK